MNEPLKLDFDRTNYRSIVLAGLGAVGQGILAIGKEHLRRFEEILLLDNNPVCTQKAAEKFNYPAQTVDIEDSQYLCGILASLKKPVLLVNACSSIDTVQLRRRIRSFPVGYIDICESRTPYGRPSGFTVSMPYTNEHHHGDFPHLICQGCNPGMVEYMARMLMDRMGLENRGCSITIYENDQLAPSNSDINRLVSWSPQDLIDEIMMSPSMEYADGRYIEGSFPSDRPTVIQWQDSLYPAFKVGHEDIWNLGLLEHVSEAKFFYSFHHDIMGVIQADMQEAYQALRLPSENESIEGLERIAVTVESSTGQLKTLLWQLDHAIVFCEHRINAVQYQTATSVLLSVLLMQHTRIGWRTGTYNASTLPLTEGDWEVLRGLMDLLGIYWQPVPSHYVSCLGKNTALKECDVTNRSI